MGKSLGLAKGKVKKKILLGKETAQSCLNRRKKQLSGKNLSVLTRRRRGGTDGPIKGEREKKKKKELVKERGTSFRFLPVKKKTVKERGKRSGPKTKERIFCPIQTKGGPKKGWRGGEAEL